jgi:DNA polymerase III subunit delta
MQTRADEFSGLLKRRAKSLPLAVWIHGDEPLLAIEASDEYRQACKLQGFTERIVISIERTVKPDALMAHTQALSLFATRKLIEVRFTGKPVKDWGAALGAAAQQLANDTETALLVTSPHLDKPSTSTSWFGQFENSGLIVPIYPIDRGLLPKWIEQRLLRHGLKANPATIELIAARVEGNLLAADQEVKKLALLFGPAQISKEQAGELPKERLELATIPEDAANQAVLNVARYNVYDAVNAMLAGDSARLYRTLNGLEAEGEAGPFLLWALADALRTLISLRQAHERRVPLAGIMQRHRIYPPRDRLYEQAAKRCDIKQLEASLSQAALVDRIIKGAATGYTHTGTWAGLQELTLRIAQ